MPWLLRDGMVLAAIDVAPSRRDRRRGLVGRDGIDGALLLRPARAVHTLGMRFDVDVAFCASCTAHSTPPDSSSDELIASLIVLETVSMARHRVGRPRLKATCVIEAELGAFDRWRLRPGDRLEVR